MFALWCLLCLSQPIVYWNCPFQSIPVRFIRILDLHRAEPVFVWLLYNQALFGTPKNIDLLFYSIKRLFLKPPPEFSFISNKINKIKTYKHEDSPFWCCRLSIDLSIHLYIFIKIYLNLYFKVETIKQFNIILCLTHPM